MQNEEQSTNYLTVLEVKGQVKKNDFYSILLESHWERLKTLSTAQLVRIVSGIAAGLEFLHSSKVIHGQLRVSNHSLVH